MIAKNKDFLKISGKMNNQKPKAMTVFEWIFLGVVIIAIAVNSFFIWYKECVIEYVDNDDETEQEETNIKYIKEQMNDKEQIKLTIKKLNK